MDIKIGATLRAMREGKGMTQTALAEKAAINRVHLVRLELDQKKNPTLDVIFRICDALGVKPSKFVAAIEKAHEAV